MQEKGRVRLVVNGLCRGKRGRSDSGEDRRCSAGSSQLGAKGFIHAESEASRPDFVHDVFRQGVAGDEGEQFGLAERVR